MWFICLILLQQTANPAQHFGPSSVVGTARSSKTDEISGLVASRKHPDVIWVHNDSGSGPELHALDLQGNLLDSFHLKGAKAEDWEDIALGPGPIAGKDYLYLADTGNNDAHAGRPRPNVTIYRVLEPETLTMKGKKHKIDKVATFELTYPDQAHDVESLLVDPVDGMLYVFTKRDPKSIVYSFAVNNPGQPPYQFKQLAELQVTMLVAADISKDGSKILLKDYASVWYYQRNPGEPLVTALARTPERVATYIIEPQGEAVGFDATTTGFYTVGEYKSAHESPIYYYPIIRTLAP